MNKTLNYYEEHAEEYASSTIGLDFSKTQDAFLAYLNKGDLILDLGCGSGRDSKYFLEHGFLVEAVDGSAAFCESASAWTGLNVKQMLFQELNEENKYDGIWACSSILHLPFEELGEEFEKIERALKPGGVFYTSFKYGTFEGERNGRWFTYVDECRCEELLSHAPHMHMLKQWISTDVRVGRGEEQWLNILLKKSV